MEDTTFSLGSIGQGAAEEMFGDALKDVLGNIQDPNTEWKTKRKVTLTVEFAPGSDARQDAKISVAVKTSLAAKKPFGSTVVIGTRKGIVMAKEIFQESLFPEDGEHPEKKVYEIKKDKGE